MRRLVFAIAVLLLLPSSWIRGGEKNQVVVRYLDQNKPVQDYVGTRHIKAMYSKRSMNAEMEVEVSLTSERSFQYKVLSESGSGFILGKIHDALEDEKKVTESVDPAEMDFTDKNYELTASGEEYPDLLQFAGRPLRKEKYLIQGFLFLTPKGELVRVEGKLAKSPSLFTNRVELVKVYDLIQGVSLPVFLESTIYIRFLPGFANVTMQYEYSSVNGQKVVQNAE